QAAEREALAVAQLDRSRGPADDERRNGVARDGHGMALIELADFRLDLEIDQAVLQHGRGEGEADTVFLVVDGDRAERLRHQDGIFAASEEAGGVAGQGDEIRLGQAADQAPPLERIDGDVYGAAGHGPRPEPAAP